MVNKNNVIKLKCYAENKTGIGLSIVRTCQRVYLFCGEMRCIRLVRDGF